jgi:hypothetical protein
VVDNEPLCLRLVDVVEESCAGSVRAGCRKVGRVSQDSHARAHKLQLHQHVMIFRLKSRLQIESFQHPLAAVASHYTLSNSHGAMH